MVRQQEHFSSTYQRHSIPSVILSRYGVYDMELQWFTDYLFLRKQIVRFNGVLFNQIQLTLLFLIFFKDGATN